MGRPTIITSGLTKESFAERYGDAFVGRLVDLGDLIDLHPAAEP
jgi:hypothetical protein